MLVHPVLLHLLLFFSSAVCFRIAVFGCIASAAKAPPRCRRHHSHGDVSVAILVHRMEQRDAMSNTSKENSETSRKQKSLFDYMPRIQEGRRRQKTNQQEKEGGNVREPCAPSPRTLTDPPRCYGKVRCAAPVSTKRPGPLDIME